MRHSYDRAMYPGCSESARSTGMSSHLITSSSLSGKTFSSLILLLLLSGLYKSVEVWLVSCPALSAISVLGTASGSLGGSAVDAWLYGSSKRQHNESLARISVVIMTRLLPRMPCEDLANTRLRLQPSAATPLASDRPSLCHLSFSACLSLPSLCFDLEVQNLVPLAPRTKPLFLFNC